MSWSVNIPWGTITYVKTCSSDAGTQVYEELDESLTKAFEEYLRERGVDEALGAYLVEAVHDKEQREYQAWLERVQSFLHAK